MGEEITTKKKPRASMMNQQLKTTMSTIAPKSMSRMTVRKPSYGFSDISGITPLQFSSGGTESRRPILTFLNTYQLEPHVKFDPKPVTKAAEALLDQYFTGHVYNKQTSPELAVRIADELLCRVKDMDFNRYRIITTVTLIQRRAQSYSNAIAFMWDHERDNYINVQRQGHTAFIQVTVFGVYLD